MKILEKNNDGVKIEISYDEISMISSVLGVPGHAFTAPDFEQKVGFSQSVIDEIAQRLWELVKSREDFEEYQNLALKSGNVEQKRKYKTEIVLSKHDAMLLRSAFREGCIFTKEHDDFHTMTGHNWSEAQELQKQMDNLVESI